MVRYNNEATDSEKNQIFPLNPLRGYESLSE